MRSLQTGRWVVALGLFWGCAAGTSSLPPDDSASGGAGTGVGGAPVAGSAGSAGSAAGNGGGGSIGSGQAGTSAPRPPTAGAGGAGGASGAGGSAGASGAGGTSGADASDAGSDPTPDTMADAGGPTDAPDAASPGDTCSNGVRDGAETDVDCGGGTCDLCGTGMSCEDDADCQSDECDADGCDNT